MPEPIRSTAQDYSALAESFSTYIGLAVTEWRFGYPNVLRALGAIEGKRILDFGCGGGNFSAVLADLGARVVGVDASASMIELAKAHHGTKADFMCCTNPAALANYRSAFNGAVANFVLCTLPSLDQVEATAHAVRSTLADDAPFVVLNTNWELCNGADFVSFRLDHAPVLAAGQKITLTLKHAQPIAIEDYFYSRADYQSAFIRAGFRDVRCVDIPPAPDALDLLDERRVSPFYLLTARR